MNKPESPHLQSMTKRSFVCPWRTWRHQPGWCTNAPSLVPSIVVFSNISCFSVNSFLLSASSLGIGTCSNQWTNWCTSTLGLLRGKSVRKVIWFSWLALCLKLWYICLHSASTCVLCIHQPSTFPCSNSLCPSTLPFLPSVHATLVVSAMFFLRSASDCVSNVKVSSKLASNEFSLGRFHRESKDFQPDYQPLFPQHRIFNNIMDIRWTSCLWKCPTFFRGFLIQDTWKFKTTKTMEVYITT